MSAARGLRSVTLINRSGKSETTHARKKISGGTMAAAGVPPDVADADCGVS
jgi:hypothetical protein